MKTSALTLIVLISCFCLPSFGIQAEIASKKCQSSARKTTKGQAKNSANSNAVSWTRENILLAIKKIGEIDGMDLSASAMALNKNGELAERVLEEIFGKKVKTSGLYNAAKKDKYFGSWPEALRAAEMSSHQKEMDWNESKIEEAIKILIASNIPLNTYAMQKENPRADKLLSEYFKVPTTTRALYDIGQSGKYFESWQQAVGRFRLEKNTSFTFWDRKKCLDLARFFMNNKVSLDPLDFKKYNFELSLMASKYFGRVVSLSSMYYYVLNSGKFESWEYFLNQALGRHLNAKKRKRLKIRRELALLVKLHKANFAIHANSLLNPSQAMIAFAKKSEGRDVSLPALYYSLLKFSKESRWEEILNIAGLDPQLIVGKGMYKREQVIALVRSMYDVGLPVHGRAFRFPSKLMESFANSFFDRNVSLNAIYYSMTNGNKKGQWELLLKEAGLSLEKVGKLKTYSTQKSLQLVQAMYQASFPVNYMAFRKPSDEMINFANDFFGREVNLPSILGGLIRKKDFGNWDNVLLKVGIDPFEVRRKISWQIDLSPEDLYVEHGPGGAKYMSLSQPALEPSKALELEEINHSVDRMLSKSSHRQVEVLQEALSIMETEVLSLESLKEVMLKKGFEEAEILETFENFAREAVTY